MKNKIPGRQWKSKSRIAAAPVSLALEFYSIQSSLENMELQNEEQRRRESEGEGDARGF